MSNVTLMIGGRSYMIACADGEEDHVLGLGRMIDETLKDIGGVHNETRELLFASLLLADELHEARKKGGQVPSKPSSPSEEPGDARLAEALEAIAARLENCAAALEGEDAVS